MFLYKRDNGVWYMAMDRGGKRIRKSTGCRKKGDALKYLQQYQNQPEKSKKIILLSEFTIEFLEYSRNKHTEKTTKTYRSCLNEFNKYIGDPYLSEITIRDIEQFIHHKQTAVSIHTARRHHAHLSGAFSTAVRWGYIKNNELKNISKPSAPEQHPLYLSDEEYYNLRSKIDDPDFRDLVTVATLTGMRGAELRYLTWDSIDLRNKIINVVNYDGFTTKSKRTRQVPMQREVRNILKSRKDIATSIYVFPNRRDDVLDEHLLSRKFKRYVRRAKLNDKLSFHDLRHTCASWLVQAGVDLYVVAKILGHSSISVTQKYAHLQPSKLHDQINKIKTSVLIWPDDL